MYSSLIVVFLFSILATAFCEAPEGTTTAVPLAVPLNTSKSTLPAEVTESSEIINNDAPQPPASGVVPTRPPLDLLTSSVPPLVHASSAVPSTQMPVVGAGQNEGPASSSGQSGGVAAATSQFNATKGVNNPKGKGSGACRPNATGVVLLISTVAFLMVAGIFS